MERKPHQTPYVFKGIVGFVIYAFVQSSLMPVSWAQEVASLPFKLPKPGVMLHLSPDFTPAILKGIVVHQDNAFEFDFIIYKGDKVLSEAQKNQEYIKLIKYFLASLAVPEEDQWVNLSPYEKNRIIKPDFGRTEMGRDLLAQDYILKQITSSLIYPRDSLGKKFWSEVYERAHKQYGTTNVPVNTFNKVWIVPDNADIYEKGNIAYLYKSHLKVMLEEDYLSLNKHSAIALVSGTPKTHAIGSQVVRELVLPQLEKEVNEGKNFAPLRQAFSGVILAAWYKRALRESLLAKIYANKAEVKGVDQDPLNNDIIYRQYLRAFKKGVFNFIQEDVDKYTNETIPRKYFSGGETVDSAVAGYGLNHALKVNAPDAAMRTADDLATTSSKTDLAQVVVGSDAAMLPSAVANVSLGLPAIGGLRAEAVKKLAMSMGFGPNDNRIFSTQRLNDHVPESFRQLDAVDRNALRNIINSNINAAVNGMNIAGINNPTAVKPPLLYLDSSHSVTGQNLRASLIDRFKISDSKQLEALLAHVNSLILGDWKTARKQLSPQVKPQLDRLIEMRGLVDRLKMLMAQDTSLNATLEALRRGDYGENDTGLFKHAVDRWGKTMTRLEAMKLKEQSAAMPDMKAMNDITSRITNLRERVKAGQEIVHWLDQAMTALAPAVTEARDIVRKTEAKINPDIWSGNPRDIVSALKQWANTVYEKQKGAIVVESLRAEADKIDRQIAAARQAADYLDGQIKSFERVNHATASLSQGARVAQSSNQAIGRHIMTQDLIYSVKGLLATWDALDDAHRSNFIGLENTGYFNHLMDNLKAWRAGQEIPGERTIIKEALNGVIAKSNKQKEKIPENDRGRYSLFMGGVTQLLRKLPIDKAMKTPSALKRNAAMARQTSAKHLGGIDLNAVNLNLHIKRDGNGVPLPLSQQNLEDIHIDGLTPVILDIKPATSSPVLSQLQVAGTNV